MVKENRDRLDLLQPEVREKARSAFDRGQRRGLDICIVSTLRTYPEQQELYAQGRTKPGNVVTNAKPGYSYHNFGLALDFAVIFKTRDIGSSARRGDWRAVRKKVNGGFNGWSTFDRLVQALSRATRQAGQ